jgi:cation transport regulator ChaC
LPLIKETKLIGVLYLENNLAAHVVKNWGSADNPCPTLNLVADPSRTCEGLAFQFPDESRPQVINYLEKREGKGFNLDERELHLENGNRVNAIVPIYSGKNLVDGMSCTELAAMARTAEGDSGRCIDYARQVAKKLEDLGIVDPDVDEFWRALKQAVGAAAQSAAPPIR